MGFYQAEKIVALTTAANVELEPIWATLLEKALAGKNVKELLLNVGAGGGAPAAGSAAVAGGGGGPATEAPKEEEKKEEEKEESDDDMVRFLADIFIKRLLMFWVCAGLRIVRLISLPSYIYVVHSPYPHCKKLFKHSSLIGDQILNRLNIKK